LPSPMLLLFLLFRFLSTQEFFLPPMPDAKKLSR
jgi:hypothetical protein